MQLAISLFGEDVEKETEQIRSVVRVFVSSEHEDASSHEIPAGLRCTKSQGCNLGARG